MSGQTKIMTVSYGTFSCTLEGFDDPLPPFVAVMEYFRDLSERDAGFGLQPLVPDESAIERFALLRGGGSVDAQVGEAGLMLRPRQIEAFAEPPAVPAPPRVTTEAQAAMIARQNRIRSAVSQFRGDAVLAGTAIVKARTDDPAIAPDRLRLENPLSFSVSSEPGAAAPTAPETMEPAPSSLSAGMQSHAAGRDIALRGAPVRDATQGVRPASARLASQAAPGGALLLTGALPGAGSSQTELRHDRPVAGAGGLPAPEMSAPADQTSATLARATVAEAGDPQDTAVERLLHYAQSEFDQPAHRRRFSAISHLKAAVAATEAEKRGDAPGVSRSPTQIDRYRDDLARAVRPTEPQPGLTSDHHAAARSPVSRQDAVAPGQPFLLGQSLRVNGAASDGVFTGRRHFASPQEAEMAAQEDDDYDDEADEVAFGALAPANDSFRDFAARIGARGLPELLEAAAAHAACVEGREHFSRPHIVRKVVAYSAGQGITREDGLRSFGMLLRQGKIRKVEHGQFALSHTSRFIPEAQRLAR